MFEARGLVVGYPDRELVRDASFALQPGERVALRGPSGSGKTTLLRTLSGLMAARGGELRLDERTPTELGWPLYRRRVVQVAQTPVWLGGTLREELARSFAYRSADTEFPVDRARDWLARLRVDVGLDRPAGELSVGQAQRVALVRAALVGPSVLLLDEPTSALDDEAEAAVESWLSELSAAGTALLVVTHDDAQERRLCERVLALRDGVLREMTP